MKVILSRFSKLYTLNFRLCAVKGVESTTSALSTIMRSVNNRHVQRVYMLYQINPHPQLVRSTKHTVLNGWLITSNTLLSLLQSWLVVWNTQ